MRYEGETVSRCLTVVMSVTEADPPPVAPAALSVTVSVALTGVPAGGVTARVIGRDAPLATARSGSPFPSVSYPVAMLSHVPSPLRSVAMRVEPA